MGKSVRVNFNFICLLIIALGFFSLSVNATTYYVSSLGNDANSGTNESLPWRSLAKVNSLIPRPGDVILFRSGDEWSGTITVKASGALGSPITYGAYGTGAKPKIYGSEKISGWVQYSGNIFKASFSKPITQLFLDGTRMKVARYPNTGYIKISAVNSQTQITCNTLPAGINFVGSKLSIRTNNWRVDTRTVTASTANTLTFDSPASYALTTDLEFFLCNELQFIDSPGEWYYDSASMSVYFWATAGDSPANHIVRGSVYNNGLDANSKDYIVVQGLDFSQHTEMGISIKGNSATIDNNYVFGNETTGINNVGSYSKITNNKIDGINHIGIALDGANSNISDNEVLNTALFDNLGLKGMQGYSQVISVSGDINFIRYNSIINAAYNGITWFGLNNIIEYNYIDNVCSILTDGGAIYTYSLNVNDPGVSGSIVRGNIVQNLPKITYAIYMDQNTRDVLIEKNTVAHCQNVGIFVHIAKNIVVRNNTLFDITRGMRAKGTYGGNSFTNNIICNIKSTTDWYNNVPVNPTLAMIKSTENTIILDNNSYIDHHRKSVFMNTVTTNYLDFSQWKTSTGQDLNSSFDGTALATGEAEELFYNNTKQVKTIDLGVTVYRDIIGNLISGTINLEPFTSKILIKTTAVIIPDKTAPIISSFTIPSNFASLTIPISSFIATDNKAVTGYKLTETSLIPNATDIDWSVTPPTSYTFSTTGSKILYAWAKDEAGNISTSISAQVLIALPNLSNTFSEYLFEESSGSTVFDSNGPNNGTIINVATRVVGVRGSGLEFTGSGFINLGQVFSDNVQNELTLSAWIKPATISGSWQGIITHEGPNYNTYALYINRDLKKIGFKTSGTSPQWAQWSDVDNTTLWDGKWHQIAVTYNGSQKIFYLDGIVIKTVNSTGSIDSGTGYNLSIGAASKELPVSSLYNGQIDEVRIYNYALINSEISDLFNRTNSPFSEYLFEEPSGSTILDSKGLNNGTIINSATRVIGVNGNGLEFLGSGYISLGQAFSENIQNELTLSAWIKPAAMSGSWQGIITHEGLNYNTFSLYINPDLRKIGFKTTGTSPQWYQWIDVNNATLWDGSWHQITVTYDGIQKTIYLDGIVLKSVNSTGSIESGKGYNLMIGAASKELPATSLYKGKIDEVRIYNYALTNSEITNLMNLVSAQTLKSGLVPNVEGELSNNKQDNSLSSKNNLIDQGSSDFSMYPNPAKSYFNIDYFFLPAIETKIIILDGTGKVIFTKLVNSTSNRIDMSNFSDGIYYIKSTNPQSNITKKLVIIR
jgi:hypothetical protein